MWRLINVEKVSSIVASPFIVMQLAKHGMEQTTKPAITEMVTGGGPLFPDEAAILIHAFPQTDITIVYGSTEAEPISHIKAYNLAQSGQEVDRSGLPVGQTDRTANVTIVPFQKEAFEPMTLTEWRQRQLPAGMVGEIVVTGNHVVTQYVSNKEAERLHKIYVAGTVWHRTGDAGRLDERSRLFLYGPCSEVIKHNGKLFYPFLVAQGIRHVEGITDAALFKKDNIAVLAISVAAAFQQADLMCWLEQHHLTGIKICKLPAIPKDARHRTKIDYARLRKLCAF